VGRYGARRRTLNERPALVQVPQSRSYWYRKAAACWQQPESLSPSATCSPDSQLGSAACCRGAMVINTCRARGRHSQHCPACSLRLARLRHCQLAAALGHSLSLAWEWAPAPGASRAPTCCSCPQPAWCGSPRPGSRPPPPGHDGAPSPLCCLPACVSPTYTT